MVFRRLFFAFLFFERLLVLLRKLFVVAVYLVFAADTIYIIKYGMESFVRLRLLYHPIQMLEYFFDYLKWLVSAFGKTNAANDPSARHYIQFMIACLVPFFLVRILINGYRLFCRTLKMCFTGKVPHTSTPSRARSKQSKGNALVRFASKFKRSAPPRASSEEEQQESSLLATPSEDQRSGAHSKMKIKPLPLNKDVSLLQKSAETRESPKKAPSTKTPHVEGE